MWEYLHISALRTRYAMAGSLLSNSKYIVEVGAFGSLLPSYLIKKTCIDLIDPLLKIKNIDKSNKHKIKYLKIDFDLYLKRKLNPDKYDVVFLGLDLISGNKSEIENISIISKFIFFCSNANFVLIEYPVGFFKAKRQCEVILSILKPKIEFDSILDFTRSPNILKIENCQERAGLLTRRMILFKKPEKIQFLKIKKKVAKAFYGPGVLVLGNENEKIELKNCINLHDLRHHNNNPKVQCLGNDSFNFKTLPLKWAYAWDISFKIPEENNKQPIFVQILANTERGSFGVSLYDSLKNIIYSELLFGPKDNGIKKIISLKEDQKLRILIRNGPHDCVSKIKSFQLSFFTIKPKI